MNIQGAPAWLSIGWIIALIVLVLTIVLVVVGRLDLTEGGLIGGLALARLIP